MASVLRIEDKRLSRQGALKIMLPELASDPEAVQRFLREAEHTASLNHPGIPAVYDYGFNAQNQAFLLMEVVEDKSLDQLLKSGEFSLEVRTRSFKF